MLKIKLETLSKSVSNEDVLILSGLQIEGVIKEFNKEAFIKEIFSRIGSCIIYRCEPH